MPISTRTYLLVAFGFGIVVFLLGMVVGEDIAKWAAEQRTEVEGTSSFIAMIAFEPLRFAFSPDSSPYGAIVVGIFWPFAMFWPILILIGLVIAPGASAISDVKKELYYYHTMFY